MLVPIVIIVILLVAAVSVVMLAGRARAASTGALSRETRERDDRGRRPRSRPRRPSTSTELEATGRERSDETRASSFGGVLVRRRGGEVVEYEPVDEEEIGVNRRQFLNRGILIAVGFGLAGFGAAMLALPLAVAGSRRIRRHRQHRQARRHPRRHRRAAEAVLRGAGPRVRRALPERRPGRARRGEEGLQARDLHGHVDARDRRALPAVRAPRLSRAVLPDVAVVRVPVPRLEVQPGRREEGRPRAAWSRPLLRDAVERRQHHRRHRQHLPRARRSARTRPARTPRARCACDRIAVRRSTACEATVRDRRHLEERPSPLADLDQLRRVRRR